MPTSVWILLLVIAVVGTWWLFVHLNKVSGETAEQRTYANYCEPIFIEQQFFGHRFQERAVEDYEYIVSRIKEHGNKYLNPEKDVHLFIHRFDVQNPILDFADWQIKVKQDQQKILQDFFLPMAARAEQSGDKAAAARFYAKAGTDFVKDKNGQL